MTIGFFASFKYSGASLMNSTFCRRAVRTSIVLSCFAAWTIAAVADPKAADGAETSQTAELKIVKREEWGSKPQPIDASKRQTPTFFTIHHEGVLWKVGTDAAKKLRNVQSWGQREKNWPDLPYHYIIAPDGTVYEGRDWNFQPESNTSYDLNGVLNIELLGNFEEQRVSLEQLHATVALLAKLSIDLKVDPATIRGHMDAAPDQTVCPGKDLQRYIEKGLLRGWVEQTIRGESPKIAELEPLAGGPTTKITDAAPTTKPE